MRWILALLVVLLVAGLAWLFTAAARLIRRDVHERFDRIRIRLGDDAEALVRKLPYDR